jgi:hypothetical protein
MTIIPGVRWTNPVVFNNAISLFPIFPGSFVFLREPVNSECGDFDGQIQQGHAEKDTDYALNKYTYG